MPTVKRARLYLTRKYKRSILLFFLLFVISFSIALALSIWNSINAVTKEVERSLGTSITLKLSSATQTEGFYQDHMIDVIYKNGNSYKCYNGPPLTDDTIRQILKGMDGFISYNADDDTYGHLDGLKLIPGLWDSSIRKELWGGGITPEVGEMYSRQTIIYGNTDSSLYSEFRSGSFSLVEGRHLVSEQDQGKVLISDELAKRNGLEIGDTFDVSVRAGFVSNENPLERWGEPRTLEIIGIFHVNGYQPVGDYVSEADITYNYIFTDLGTIKYLEHVSYQEGQEHLPVERYRHVTFFVGDTARLPDMLVQMKELECINSPYYDISIDDTMYKSTIDPLNTIRNLVAGLVLAAAAGCAVVLCVVFTMWVRSRRKEIAVYLSMGFRKTAVLGQFVLEAALVALLAGVLSFAACQKVPDLIGNRMLASTIEAAQPKFEEPTREDIHQAAQGGTTSELFAYVSGSYAGPEHIDFTFGVVDFLVLLLLELLIITGAICWAGRFIFEWEPRKIMTTLK